MNGPEILRGPRNDDRGPRVLPAVTHAPKSTDADEPAHLEPRASSPKTILTFTKVNLPWGWLSNMSPHQVSLDEVTWRTAEHLFQALRFAQESPVRALIRAQKSPMGAKMAAKAHAGQMIVAPRSEEDLAQMRQVLRRKLAQHPDLVAELARSGDALLIEDVTRRPSQAGLFWGVADPLTDRRRGLNWLGRLWMELRDEARGEHLTPPLG